MAEPMTAEALVRFIRKRAGYSEHSDVFQFLVEKVEQYAQQRFAEVSEQLKRCRIHALNAESEAASLRAEVRNIRKELDEALGRWAP